MFDPFSTTYQANPHQVLADIRGTEPIFFAPELGSWVVTRHDTIKAILRDTVHFSSRIVSDPLVPLCPHAKSIISDSNFDVPPMLVNNDPPSHARYRKFFSEPLQRARMLKLEPFVRQTVNGKIDAMLAAERPVDLVAALTFETPMLVLFRALGVPQEDVPTVKRWADSRVVLQWGKPSEEDQVRMAKDSVDFYAYAEQLVRRKQGSPEEDIISDLLAQRAGDDANMTLKEITGTVFNLLFAGHETTSTAAVGMFNNLLRNRPMWESIVAGAQKLDAVVEESLRYSPPIIGWRRLVKEPVEVLGQQLAAGDRVLMMLGAANRDPEVFEQPDEFRPGRQNVAQHLSFGMGIHHCAGAPLARLELTVMLELVAGRLPGMRVVEGQQLDYVPNTVAHALTKLLVTW
ncbi:cytochrome P450 [Ramlibacter sp. 2FC]|uniref:cytochrome P450 n=1 Tax=Ramlibacter sp. 2FC TaxID=2502188 RepID=UPI001485549D|nr:cytochrome P450 [Ramlibacter sp. 2FC]